MNKISLYLQEHITGEIITNTSARNFYSTDASIFKIQPNVIIYPKNESDVRKTVKFSYQLAKNRRIFPITARGSGTDQSGAAIGPGLILVFPAHFNKLLELNGKVGQVRVEPGLNFGKLQQTLLTHDFFLPCAPASLEYSTIGGALANNAAGDRSVKYGPILDYVESLRVVLSNGDIIVTKRLSKRELNKKLGLSNYEGEIYRAVDKLIDDNTQTIHESEINTARNASGYNLHLVKRKDGSFDLTPLIVGSQGTLGVITEATLATIPRRPKTTLTVALIDDLDLLDKLLVELKKSSETPSAIEMVDDNLLNLVRKTHPNLIKDLFSEHSPKFVLLIEFD
ncbi:MAG TPA: FAD-binding oxidoreductase, partial [Candidatus Saccharimonadia bacterium]|nr:FAD-binding oxidoreductase [Candidatus Saccharimonadia bacterium]